MLRISTLSSLRLLVNGSVHTCISVKTSVR
jgi:hypothetical protein